MRQSARRPSARRAWPGRHSTTCPRGLRTNDRGTCISISAQRTSSGCAGLLHARQIAPRVLRPARPRASASSAALHERRELERARPSSGTRRAQMSRPARARFLPVQQKLTNRTRCARRRAGAPPTAGNSTRPNVPRHRDGITRPRRSPSPANTPSKGAQRKAERRSSLYAYSARIADHEARWPLVSTHSKSKANACRPPQTPPNPAVSARRLPAGVLAPPTLPPRGARRSAQASSNCRAARVLSNSPAAMPEIAHAHRSNEAGYLRLGSASEICVTVDRAKLEIASSLSMRAAAAVTVQAQRTRLLGARAKLLPRRPLAGSPAQGRGTGRISRQTQGLPIVSATPPAARQFSAQIQGTRAEKLPPSLATRAQPTSPPLSRLAFMRFKSVLKVVLLDHFNEPAPWG